MDVLRHHRSLALLIFLTYFGVASAEHLHRHRHNGTRERRENHNQRHYFVENVETVELGEWGPWTPTGECSRSCGGGVGYEIRECNSIRADGSRGCRGASKRYFSCNIHDCPELDFDFRAYQCSQFDSIPFDDAFYTWIPYTKAPNKCELNCMPRNERFYYRHKKQVIDGTLCDEEKPDICVNGKCLPVGCDRVLGSPAREDKCRVCGGDGNSCNTIKGILDTNELQVGYNDLLLIPAGAMNIKIRELQSSNNYLAVRNLTGYYYLNGNWRIDFPRSFRFVGTVFHYERRSFGLASPESLTALGPINEALYIVVLYQEKNTGIEYEYSITQGTISLTDPDGYRWLYDNFTSCSATCGGGYRVRNVWCARKRDSSPASNDLCDPAIEPIKNQSCATEPCPPKWSIGEWSSCSSPCGTNGVQNRTVQCEQIISNGRSQTVDENLCKVNVPEPPISTQPCNVGLVCPKWFIGPWKACDKLCGNGFQRREVKCYYKTDGKINVTSDSSCPEAKPEWEKSCFVRPCEGVDWIVSEWSGCEDKCDMTTENRRAVCSTNKGKIYPNEYCKESKLPPLVRDCSAPACEYLWYATEWSKCSSKCGSGVQTRKVFCGTFKNDSIMKVDDTKCDADKKYESNKNCTGSEKCKGDWFAGPWGKCDKTCGGGTMSRKVLCFLENQTVDATHCDPVKIVFASESCNAQPCGKDEIVPVMETNTNIEENVGDDCEEYEEIDVIIISKKEDSNAMKTSTTDNPIIEKKFGETTTAKETEMSTTTKEPEMSTTIKETETSTTTDNETVVDTVTPSVETTENVTDSADLTTTDLSTMSDTTIVSPSNRRKREVAGEEGAAVTTGGTLSNETTTDSDSMSSTEMNTEMGSSESVSSSSASDVDAMSEVSSSESSVASSTESSTSSSSASDVSAMSEASSTESSPASSSTSDVSAMSEASSTESSPTSSSVSDVSAMSEVSTSESSTSSSTELNASSSSVADTSPMSEASSTESSASSSAASDVGTMSEASTSESSAGSSMETSASPSSISDTSSSDGSVSSSTSNGNDTELESSSVSTVLESSQSSSESNTESVSSESMEMSSMSSNSGGSTSSSTDSMDSSSTSSMEDVSKSDTSTMLITTSEPAKTKSKTIVEIIKIEDNPKQCKRRKKKKQKCESSEFGCCVDGVTSATGPFNAGCSEISTCQETKHGCCSDGVTPIIDGNANGCPIELCSETLYGCCPDRKTPAKGNDNEGCPFEVAVTASSPKAIIDCKNTSFGCCPDGQTAAKSKDFEGCPMEKTTLSSDCKKSEFGCCPDGIMFATGPNFVGCDDMEGSGDGTSSSSTATDGYSVGSTGGSTDSSTDKFDEDACESSAFGCCDDNTTAAHGPNKEGCCLNSAFGCCPDNILAASGPSLEGCGCQYTLFGCCPDNVTSARGAKNEGCGCEYSEFGCCPNKYTPAGGTNFRGCPCYTYQFGCCPDGVTKALGPNFHGCSCEYAEFGCCADGKTPASDATRKCTCEASKYGCCPDGTNEARGEDFEGCENVPLKPGETCIQPKDKGSCRDFKVKWFFDTEYGGCSRFWYGGCEGNANRFQSQDECRSTCVEPTGRDACFLPKIQGPCEGYYPSWYYDSKAKQCRQFIYGGCLGNNNKFQTYEECEQMCVLPDRLEPCQQNLNRGPCDGNYTRWYFDEKENSCQKFSYGGCKGNQNNFLTEMACQHKCLQTGKTRQECLLPKISGNCTKRKPRWFFDPSENRCVPFYYTGCGGNINNFESINTCENACPAKIEQKLCLLPAITGECHNYTERWYFNVFDNRCSRFYYGGCGGNGNNFVSEADCNYRCNSLSNVSAPPPIVSSEPTPPEGPALTQADVCRQIVDRGPCEQRLSSWYFDVRTFKCERFEYGGCGGNQNRFETEEHCDAYCGFLRTNGTVELQPSNDKCELARRDCESLRDCPYGVERWIDDEKCEKCGCVNPCNKYECPPGQRCGLTRTENGAYRPICRLSEKPGICPQLNDSTHCRTVCRTDADCVDDEKCCRHNCGSDCVLPWDVESIFRGTSLTETPLVVLSEKNLSSRFGDAYSPQIDQNVESDVESEEGNYATLRCIAFGIPKPVITWQKGVINIDRSVARYKLTDGILHVVGLHKNDAGVYVCTASNGVGPPATKEFRLNVKDGVNRQAEILPDAQPATVVTLGAPTVLQCFAYGYPNPTVTWWKEDKMLPPQSDRYEQRRDHSLAVFRVEMRTLGPYTCQAYNGQGRAASWTITLHAVGTALPLGPDELAYSIYLVPPPKAPPVPSDVATESVTPNVIAVVTTYREVSVPLSTSILTNQTNFAVGSDVSLQCSVSGPATEVIWFKDGVPIERDNRISISVAETNRLVVRDASVNDSGVYKCEAIDKFHVASSNITLIVEGVYIHPYCLDNPFYANCSLIVQGQLCKHKYYGKFCCRSCTKAGQLPSYGEHLAALVNDAAAGENTLHQKRHARHARDLVKFLSLKN